MHKLHGKEGFASSQTKNPCSVKHTFNTIFAPWYVAKTIGKYPLFFLVKLKTGGLLKMYSFIGLFQGKFTFI